MRYIEVIFGWGSNFLEADFSPRTDQEQQLDELRRKWNEGAKVPDRLEFADMSDRETWRRFHHFCLRTGITQETGPAAGWVPGCWP